VRQSRVDRFSIVLSIPRRVMFPRSGLSLGYARRWLLAGTRLSTIAIGLCLIFNVRQWYFWIPIVAAAVFFVGDMALAYRYKCARKAQQN
jgi:CHASE2 domain-containing sensor protein